MRNPRALWAGLIAVCALLLHPSAPVGGPAEAQASVSVALSLQELVGASDRAIVATGLERRSAWEQVEGSRRIVTYTKLRIEQTLYGPESEVVWLRTLGGVVGKIGQHVSGEARVGLGQRCLLFLSADPRGVLLATGRAQGHYPIALDSEGNAKLRPSPDRGKVVHRRGPSISAHEALVGQRLPTALTAVRRARERHDASR